MAVHPRRRVRTPEMDAEVCRKYLQHVDLDELAQIYGIGKTTVWHILVDNNVPRRRVGRVATRSRVRV